MRLLFSAKDSTTKVVHTKILKVTLDSSIHPQVIWATPQHKAQIQ